MTRPAAPRRRTPPPGRRRRGVSLLELVLVTVLLGIFAAAAVSRSGGAFGDVASRTRADRYAALAHAARRRAILDGRDHGVWFEKVGGKIVRVELSRWEGAARTPLGEALDIPPAVAATSAASQLRYTFEGAPAGAGVLVEFRGPRQAWEVWQSGQTALLRTRPIP